MSLQQRSTIKKTGRSYNLLLSNYKNTLNVYSVGIWGQRHYNYLKKSNPTVVNVMRMKGTLEQYLTDLDRDAQDMFDLLMKQYAEIEGLTEQIKSENQMVWVRQMNNIRNRVTEIVCKELIYI